MEYIVECAIVIILLGTALYFWFKEKKFNVPLIAVVILELAIEKIKKSEPEIVQGVYNLLPDKIKKEIGSKAVAYIVSIVLDLAVDAITPKETSKDQK